MKQESILKGVLLYSISTWVNLVLGFLTVTITTRVLLPDVYGQVSIFNSITSVLMYILLLGMDGAYVRYYNELPAMILEASCFIKICFILLCFVC